MTSDWLKKILEEHLVIGIPDWKWKRDQWIIERSFRRFLWFASRILGVDEYKLH